MKKNKCVKIDEQKWGPSETLPRDVKVRAHLIKLISAINKSDSDEILHNAKAIVIEQNKIMEA